MGAISRGVEFLRRQQAAQEARENQAQIWKLWVASGDTAKFWFLGSDIDKDMMAPMVHSLERTAKAGNKFKVDVLCQRESKDDPIEDCEYCSEGVEGPWYRLISWVYADQIIHEKNPKNKEWTLAKKGNLKVYEEIPEPRLRLFIMKTKLAQQVMRKFDELETIYDRPFKIEKSGSGLSTVELLSCPDDAMNIPDAVAKANAELPSLEDAIRAEFGRYAPRKGTSLSGRGQLTTAAVDDEDEDEVVDFN